MRAIFIAAILAMSVAAFARGAGSGVVRRDDDEAVKGQVLTLFKIFKNRDWKGLWSVVQFSPAVMKVTTDPDAFADGVAKGIKESDPQDALGTVFGGMTDVGAGLVLIENEHARVATTCKVATPSGSTVFVGIATLVKVGGVWKWDLTFDDDPEKVTAQRMQEMIGSPAQWQK